MLTTAAADEENSAKIRKKNAQQSPERRTIYSHLAARNSWRDQPADFNPTPPAGGLHSSLRRC
jgi:hypothetical protein